VQRNPVCSQAKKAYHYPVTRSFNKHGQTRFQQDPMTYFIAVDLGTSSAKTALYDADGRRLAEAAAEYVVARPQPDWAEMDVEDWWRAVCATVRQVVGQAGIDRRDVRAIGVDGVSWTLIPVDRELHALCPAMIWLDRRAEEQAAWLRAQPEAHAWVDLVANPLDAAYVTPKLLWLKQHHPQVFESAHCFLNSTGYIVARLSGALTCDFSQAYAYHFYDMRRGCWDETAAQRLGIPLEKMPGLVSPLDVVGNLTAQAAGELDLPQDVLVIAGGLDAAAGALGTGVVRLGQTVDQGGQAGGMLMSVERVIVEPLLIFSNHILPGQYLFQSGTVGGGSLGWFRDVLGQAEVDAARVRGISPFELMSEVVENTPAGARGVLFLPYMAGERTPLWDSNARGVFFGLSYKTTQGDVLRAIMEGCAFAVYHGLKIAEAQGVTVGEWLGDGGAARSAPWCQIKADITGRPFIVARQADGSEGGHTLGLFAMLAQAVGLCRVDELPAYVESLLPERRIYQPDPVRHVMYNELFEIYQHLSGSLREDFHGLAGVVKKYNLSA
jgi:xylulokinase